MSNTKNRLSHVKEIYYIVSSCALLAISVSSIWGPGGYLEMKKTRADLEARKTRVIALQRSNQARRQEIQKLRSDRETLESYAREKNYGRKGEIVQQLPQQETPRKP